MVVGRRRVAAASVATAYALHVYYAPPSSSFHLCPSFSPQPATLLYIYIYIYVYVYVHIPTLSSPSSSLSPHPSLFHHQPPKTSLVVCCTNPCTKDTSCGCWSVHSLSFSLSLILSSAHTFCARSPLLTLFSLRYLCPPRLLLTLPPPILNRVVSRTLGATFSPSLSKQDPLETETAKSPHYLLFLALSLSFFLSLVELK